MGNTNGHGGARKNTGNRYPQKMIEMELPITLTSGQWNRIHEIAQFVDLNDGEVIKDMIKIFCHNMSKDKEAPIKLDTSYLVKELKKVASRAYFKSLSPSLSKKRVQITLPYDLYEKLEELFRELRTDETYSSLVHIYGEYEENENQRDHGEKHYAEPHDIPLYTFAIMHFFLFLDELLKTTLDITPYIKQPKLFFKTKKNNDKRIKKYLDWWQSPSGFMVEHEIDVDDWEKDVMDEEERNG